MHRASCEKLFNPKLKNKPVVVLSNNDGCVIARSKEAKKLKIKMGAPIFEYKELIKKKIIHVFSSNFSLYGDMSMRVMKTLESFLFPIEIYSIDEAFLDLTNQNIDYLTFAKNLKEKVYKWTGIDVSAGIAKTKTLAKLANEIAKKQKGYIVLTDKKDILKTLKNTALEDVWGIGNQLKKRLYRLGIYSAFDLAIADPELIKKISITILKTALELNQKTCFKCENVPEAKQSICTSRSFANKVSSLKDLEKAISSFVAIAAKKLRKQKMLANFLTIFISTSFHSKDPFYANSCSISLPTATSFTPNLITHAKKALKMIYKNSYLYKKAGIILSDFSSKEFVQNDLFTKLDEKHKNDLMKIIDEINYKANKKAIFFASEGIKNKKPSKIISSSKMRSNKYSTSFDELLEVK